MASALKSTLAPSLSARDRSANTNKKKWRVFMPSNVCLSRRIYKMNTLETVA